MKSVLAVAVALAVVGMASLAQANATRGPQRSYTTVEGKSTDRYEIEFNNGELAQVRVHSYGDTYVQVTVYDGYGNPITSGTDKSGSDIVLNWRVTRGGVFIIRVQNPSSLPNTYLLTTN